MSEPLWFQSAVVWSSEQQEKDLSREIINILMDLQFKHWRWTFINHEDDLLRFINTRAAFSIEADD